MDERTWYLGPLGDLRGLISPDGGVERTVQRYGGVHQALSGARTMDITGHRASYTLPVPAVTPAESRFVEALHQRTVPGPYRLLDPLSRNRLPRNAALLKPFTAEVTVTSGGVARSTSAPTSSIGVPVTSLLWSSYSAGASLALPAVPVLADEVLTFSLWIGGSTDITAELSISFTGLDGASLGRATRTAAVTGGSWRHCQIATAAPEGAIAAEVRVAPEAAPRVFLAAAQVEPGEQAGEFDLGGGAPTVVIDQLERSSPIYPLNDMTLTLLEV